MKNSLFQSILFESQQQFEQLLEDNKVGNTLKKAGSTIKKAGSNIGSNVKKTSSNIKSGVKETATNIGENIKEKSKSGLDSLKTVSKNTSSKVSEKIKSVGNKVKETAKDPIKAGTLVGAVAGGAGGAVVGFGVGNMVKDISDGVKEVKNKLLENLNWEEREKLLEQERKEFKLFIKKYGLQTIFKDSNYWSKRGGYVGQKTINNTISKLITKGWKTVDLKTLYKGGGENVLNKIVYLSPEKNYYIETSAYYGNVASDNMFNMNIINMKDKLFENLMLQSQQEFTDLFESTKDLKKLQSNAELNLYSHNIDSDLEDEFYSKSSNLQFTINRSYNQLFKLFGKPIKNNQNSKITYLWFIYIKEFDTIISIYDWKEENSRIKSKNIREDWYVAFNEKDSKYADDIKKLLDRYYNPSSNGKLFENLMLQSQQEFTDLFESKKDKFSLAFDKMDKWMPDDSDIQNDFYEAIENKNKKKGILEIEDILIYADEDILSERYNISSNEYSKFAKYLYEVNQ